MTEATQPVAAPKPFYLDQNASFGIARAEDDFLHTRVNSAVKDDALTETQFFSFYVPEERVYVIGYLWHHPNLSVVTGGIWGFQGIKRHNLACEMFDIRAFMHDRVLAKDLHDYRLINGYGVQVLEPLKRMRMTYFDTARKNSVDVEFEAVAPAVMFGNGLHFEQAMKVRGEVVLRGRRYDVAGYSVRDRSWGKPRTEDGMSLPPIAWKTGVFGDDFAFECMATDEPTLMPEWKGKFDQPGTSTLKAGWIQKQGKTSLLTSCRKRTERDPTTLFPTAIEWEATDEHGHQYHFKGTVIATNDWSVQSNLRFVANCVRWECEGRIAYGEMQEAHWNDFVHAFLI